MNTEQIKKITEIDFRDIKVNVYYYPDNKDILDRVECIWQMRNPDSCYRGVMFMNNETGKLSYPEDAIIPEQIEKDREILPKAIIVGVLELGDTMIKNITIYLEKEYLRRNKIK